MRLMRKIATMGAALAAARRYARQNPAKVNGYADRAATFVDRKTGGRYRRQIDSALRQIHKETGVPGRTQAMPPRGYGAQGSGGYGGYGNGHETTRSYPSFREDRPR